MFRDLKEIIRLLKKLCNQQTVIYGLVMHNTAIQGEPSTASALRVLSDAAARGDTFKPECYDLPT